MYWYKTHPRAKNQIQHLIQSRTCVKYLGHSDPTQANICKIYTSYRCFPRNHVLTKYLDKIPRSYRTHPGKRVCNMLSIHIPSVKYYLDRTNRTDHTRQTCAEHADHTDTTHSNMCEISRPFRCHAGKHVCKS